VATLVSLLVLLALVALTSPWPPALFVGVFLVSIAASSLAVCLQMRLMETAGEAQMLGAALNHSPLNMANAPGAWVGGAGVGGRPGVRARPGRGAGREQVGLSARPAAAPQEIRVPVA